MFEGNDDVSFGDVNLSEEQIRGDHNPGQGGWPTIRYFNKETGYEGASYVKKTSEAMCTELGPGQPYMQQYIEEAGKTSLCSVETKAGCSEKQSAFIDTWKEKSAEEVQSQLTRLQGMADKPMQKSLKHWVKARIDVLSQLANAAGHTEL